MSDLKKFLRIEMSRIGAISVKDIASDELITVKHHERVNYVTSVFHKVRNECYEKVSDLVGDLNKIKDILDNIKNRQTKKTNDLREDLNKIVAENNRKINDIEASFDTAQAKFFKRVMGSSSIKISEAEEEYQRKTKIISDDLDKIIDGYYKETNRIGELKFGNGFFKSKFLKFEIKTEINDVGALSKKDMSDNKLIRTKHYERMDYAKNVVFRKVRIWCDKKVNDLRESLDALDNLSIYDNDEDAKKVNNLKEDLAEIEVESDRKMENVEKTFDAAQTKFLARVTGPRKTKTPGDEEEFQRKTKIISDDLDRITNGCYNEIGRIKKLMALFTRGEKNLSNVTLKSSNSEKEEEEKEEK